MLQVVDEFDDVVGAVRHQLEGIGLEIGPTVGGLAALGAIALAVAMGGNALIVATSIGILGAAAFLKAQGLLPHR
jgi:hypothetical protein